MLKLVVNIYWQGGWLTGLNAPKRHYSVSGASLQKWSPSIGLTAKTTRDAAEPRTLRTPLVASFVTSQAASFAVGRFW